MKNSRSKGKVAVFLSGRGSNFQALYNASQAEESNFEITAVISDQKEAVGLSRAHELNIPAYYISPKRPKTKSQYETEIISCLQSFHIELICLAGYMRLVGPDLLAAYPNRIMNIHPALLPSFPGLHAQAQAIAYGVKISGCTVHFVDSGMDSGPIILQKAVEVLDQDSDETLSQRILAEEHKLYARAVTLFFQDRLQISTGKVIIKP